MTPEEEIHRYKSLLDTARCFGRAMDLRTLIDEILDRSRDVMRAEACTLFLPDPATGDLILHSTDPRVRVLPQPLKVPAGQGFAGVVFQTRQSLNVHDAQRDPRHYQLIGKKVGVVSRAMITVPLLDGADCLGVLQAMNPRDREYFDAQDQEIFEGFGGLIVNALLRLEAQKREVEQAQADQELLLAREIQNSFLPASPQEFSFGRVHLKYFPAKMVGGDFCFVHAISGERLLAGLGDVSGKGVPAALTMARATAMIRAMVSQLQADLGAWVETLNRQLVEELKGGRFISMTFLLADGAASSLQSCAAGQFSPFHSDGKQWEQARVRNQLPLGISPTARYQTTSEPLQPGAFWILFSDGITEARNSAGEELTASRFAAGLPVGQTAAGTLISAMESWRSFVGSAAQHDDASLLLLEWRGAPPPHELSLTCCPENLRLCRNFIEQWAQYAAYDDITAGQIVVACDEAVTNIFRHGYERTPGPLRFQAEVTEDSLCVKMIDEAKPVNPSKIKARDLADIRPGGLGTFIISKVFDEVRYDPREMGTVLTLRKRLP